MKNVSIKNSFEDILGVISPHAGYVYSGQCAAYSFSAISKKKFKTAVIIAPSHRHGNFKFSAGNYESYLTPLGEVEIEKAIVEKLLTYADFTFHTLAHNTEHSLEVQLPFLQMVNKKAKIVPILLGNQTFENSEKLAEILIKEFRDQMEDTVFIISSDLSHYYQGNVASAMDSQLIDLIAANDMESIAEKIFERKIEACGFGGIMVILQLARKLDYDRTAILNYTHSGQITGDDSQVVGYLSAAIHK